MGTTAQDPIEPARPDPTRRAVLLGVGGVVIGTAIGAWDASASATSHRRRPSLATQPTTAPITATTGARPTPTSASSVATVAHRSEISTRIPGWARRWDRPIYDLDDFLERAPHIHFPRRSVLLTIDDGPSPEWTPKYLRLLERHQVTATFNVIGEQVPPNRHLVRAVASQGHVIANHTWTHDEQLPYRSPARIHREIARTSEAIHAATGTAPAQFRAPGGVWGPRVFDELARQHMMPVGWDIDPRDWALPGTTAIENAMRQAGPGDIVLCHDGGGDRSETFHALRTVIPELLQRGLRFVTLPGSLPARRSG